MITVTKEQWNKISNDYKGKWKKGYNTPENYIGKRYVFEGCITDHASTSLLTEGVHFIII